METRTIRLIFLLSIMILLFGAMMPAVIGQADRGKFNPGNPAEVLKKARDGIICIFSLDFLKGNKCNVQSMQSTEILIAFMRFLVWLMVLTLAYEGITRASGLRSNTSIIIAFSFASISAAFLPDSILYAIGVSYGALVSLALIGIMVVLFFVIYYSSMPDWLKFFIMLVLFALEIFIWVWTSQVYLWAGGATGTGSQAAGEGGMVYNIVVKVFGGGSGTGPESQAERMFLPLSLIFSIIQMRLSNKWHHS